MGGLVVVGEGVWISFKQDSTLRLYNGTTFNHMQNLDIAPAIRRNISKCTIYQRIKDQSWVLRTGLQNVYVHTP